MSFCTLDLKGRLFECTAHMLLSAPVVFGTDFSVLLLLRKEVKIQCIYTVFCSLKGTFMCFLLLDLLHVQVIIHRVAMPTLQMGK